MKKLLLTGASGFLGQAMLPILREKFSVSTLGRRDGNDFCADLAREIPQLGGAFDIVVHAAGKAHAVPRTPLQAHEFFDTNFTGTQNLCRALEISGVPKSFVFISSVAVYGREFGENIAETEPLAGTSPYAKSKIAAENFLQKWCAKNGVILTILRPSLIAGADAPGNLGTMVRAIRRGQYLRVGRGNARKSIVMATDLARVILSASQHGGVFNLCATYSPTLAELENLISSQLGKKPPLAIPFFVAKAMALIGDCCLGRAPIDSARLRKITGTLTFSNAKARAELDWKPLEILENYKIEKPREAIPPPNLSFENTVVFPLGFCSVAFPCRAIFETEVAR